jgi:hypothetical protein
MEEMSRKDNFKIKTRKTKEGLGSFNFDPVQNV